MGRPPKKIKGKPGKAAKAPLPIPAWSKRLRNARELIEPNGAAFARRLRMSQQKYNNWERGKGSPSVKDWALLAKHLGDANILHIIKGPEATED